MMLKPCLSCGTPTDASRCGPCSIEMARVRRTRLPARPGRPRTGQRGYGGNWQRLSRRARSLQPFCNQCGSRGPRLEAHHMTWPARSLSDVEVLCPRCHASRPKVRAQSPGPRTDPASDTMSVLSELADFPPLGENTSPPESSLGRGSSSSRSDRPRGDTPTLLGVDPNVGLILSVTDAQVAADG